MTPTGAVFDSFRKNLAGSCNDYLSFFVQFVDPAYPYPALTFTILAVILQLISMTYLSILIVSGVKLASYFNQNYKVTASCVAAVGILFCGFGLKLATSTF